MGSSVTDTFVARRSIDIPVSSVGFALCAGIAPVRLCFSSGLSGLTNSSRERKSASDDRFNHTTCLASNGRLRPLHTLLVGRRVALLTVNTGAPAGVTFEITTTFTTSGIGPVVTRVEAVTTVNAAACSFAVFTPGVVETVFGGLRLFD
jgi:hypothetical protein